jgi:2-methylcitrate dehydratase PrpD
MTDTTTGPAHRAPVPVDAPMAVRLAHWAATHVPATDEIALAQRSLADTVAVAVAEPALASDVRPVARLLTPAGYWAAMAHVLDYDDLHVPSTTHISAVCVPATLACRGDARAFLAGAGVMARLGTALGWSHYARGWHATCTIGAPGAAVAAAVALGLPAERIAHALALAVPAAGGVQRAFGTQGKSLQVGFAVESGVRAARLAAAGGRSNPDALEEWVRLLGGDPDRLDLDGPAVPGGLAIKLAPCCYALQRPIDVTRVLRGTGVTAEDVVRLRITTPAATVQPLLYPRPRTGLEAKFSLEYGIVATMFNPFPGFFEFSDEGVTRPEVNRLIERVEIGLTEAGDDLLAGTAVLTADLRDGTTRQATSQYPPGSPARPPTTAEFRAKLTDCAPDLADALAAVDWTTGARLLGERLTTPAERA